MTNELQAGDGDLNDDQLQSAQNQTPAEGGAELAPAAGDNQDKNEDGETAQDKANKAINKQHAKFREQERRADAAEKERDALKDKLAAQEAQTGEIVIPPIPDPYDHEDDEYAELVKVRDEAIARKATQDATKQAVIEQKDANTKAAENAGAEEVTALVVEYDKRSVQLGLSPSEMAQHGKTVMDYGISGELAVHILQQEDGPLITKYLATNPLELDELRQMSNIDAALKISSTIREAAALLKPQASNAPDPAEVLSGRGAGEQISEFIKGASFE